MVDVLFPVGICGATVNALVATPIANTYNESMNAVSTLLPTPFMVLEKLRQIHPLLCLGVEQRGALLSLHKAAPALPDMPWLAASVIGWAFQRIPLYLENAQKAAAAENFPEVPQTSPIGSANFFSGKELARFAARVSGYLPDQTDPQLQDILDLYDIRLLTRFLLPKLGDKKQGFPLLASAWDRLIKCTSRDLPLTMLEATAFPSELLPLKKRLKAEWAVHHLAGDDPEQALDMLNDCDDALWGQWKLSMRAMLLVQAGETDEAGDIYTGLCRAMPWHVNSCLMAHALRYPLGDFGAGDALSRSDGVNILLYSWNKSELLARTLDSLYASERGNARIVVLDNGSTDAMADVLNAAEDRFGSDRFSQVRLPVNIGAPGARNWLLSLPEVWQRPLAAFLDDDVILPSGWLGHLLAASGRLENFGAIGCRIVSAERPYGLQSADYNNYPLDNSEGGSRLGIFNNCFGQLDMGMYGYDRPCLSVSGCCHLLNMCSIEKAGLFDIRYNPTQFDDLDHDLRSCLAGFPSYYAGSLRVCHVQHSSMEKADTMAAMGQVSGNQMKLQARFDDMELTRLFGLSQTILWDDLLRKAADLSAE